MSGPVWKLVRVAGACSSCGETVPELLAVGTVADFEFRPDFRYCRACYERYRDHRDELDQPAVLEQQRPTAVSRPVAVGDTGE